MYLTIYRIDREKRRHDVLSGKGAEIYGGRWNLPGTAAVYTAGSRSLAILEMLVHFDLRHQLPQDRILVALQIPQEYVKAMSVDEIPEDWAAVPQGVRSQQIFSDFVRSGGLALEVPSVVVPEEHNFILNPRSTAFDEVKVTSIVPLDLDKRLGLPITSKQ